MASISIPEFKTPKTALIESSQPIITEQQQAALIDEIKSLLIEKKAVLVAHYYVDAVIQTLAQTTGGHVADSLEMARFGKDHEAEMIVVAGVRFMGETAKILTPEKKIIMPTLDAECSLDLGCPAEQFIPFCDAHPDHTVVVYANTSAEVKARADYVATSGIAVKLVQSLTEQGKKILWGPDKHLGAYVQKLSGADMLIWPGACVVHEEFKTRSLGDLLSKHPNAAVLVHPESPDEMIEAADAVGSTSQLINAAKTLPHDTFIVATDKGIFHVMQQQAPDKKFIPAPTHGEGATCTSCAHCPWMAMNHLQNLRDCLRDESNEITLDPIVQKAALKSTERMLEFTAD